MKKIILVSFYCIVLISVIFATELPVSTQMPIVFDLRDIASFAEYNIWFSSDSNGNTTLTTLPLVESQKLDLNSIIATGSVYVNWNFISPYKCGIYIYSQNPLFGQEGLYGDEFIPIQATVASSDYAEVKENTVWGTTDPFDSNNKSAYTEKKGIVSLDLSAAKPDSEGSLKLDFTTGNAYGNSIQTYVCNIYFEIISEV